MGGVRRASERSTTDCDGKYRGERHFRCTPGHGLYIPLEDAEFVGISGDDDLPSCKLGQLPIPIGGIEAGMALVADDCCGTGCDYSGSIGMDGRAGGGLAVQQE